MPTQRPDRQLVEDFLANDAEAMRVIYGYIDAGIAKFRHSLKDNAEDIRQDTIIKVLSNLRDGTFNFESSLYTYVFKIAMCTSIDKIRREQTKNDPLKVERLKEKLNYLLNRQNITRQTLDTTSRVMKLLPKVCQELFMLIFVEEFSYSEIGEIQKRTEGAVKVSAHTCRKKAINFRKEVEKR